MCITAPYHCIILCGVALLRRTYFYSEKLKADLVPQESSVFCRYDLTFVVPTSTGWISSLPASLIHSARTDHHQFNLCECIHFVELKAEEAISSHTSRKTADVVVVVVVLFFSFFYFCFTVVFFFFILPSNVSNKSKINLICYLNRLKLVFVCRCFMSVAVGWCYYCDMRVTAWYNSIGHLYTCVMFLMRAQQKLFWLHRFSSPAWDFNTLDSLDIIRYFPFSHSYSLLLLLFFSVSCLISVFFVYLWNVFAFLFFYSANMLLFLSAE